MRSRAIAVINGKECLSGFWKADDNVSPDEDPLVLHVHLVQCQALQGRHRGVLGVLGMLGNRGINAASGRS